MNSWLYLLQVALLSLLSGNIIRMNHRSLDRLRDEIRKTLTLQYEDTQSKLEQVSHDIEAVMHGLENTNNDLDSVKDRIDDIIREFPSLPL